MTIEEKLKDLIIEKYGSVLRLSDFIGIPNSTIATILNRGIHKSSIDNVLAICKALQISADELSHDRIVPLTEAYSKSYPRDFDAFINHARKHIESELTLNGNPLPEEDKHTLLTALEVGAEIIRRK